MSRQNMSQFFENLSRCNGFLTFFGYRYQNINIHFFTRRMPSNRGQRYSIDMFGGSVFSSDTSPRKPKLRTFPLAQRTFNLKKFAEPRCERAATRFGEFFKLKPPNGGTHRKQQNSPTKNSSAATLHIKHAIATTKDHN